MLYMRVSTWINSILVVWEGIVPPPPSHTIPNTGKGLGNELKKGYSFSLKSFREENKETVGK